MKRALLTSIAMATALAFAAPTIAGADSHADDDSGKFSMEKKKDTKRTKRNKKGSKFFNFEGDDVDAALAQPGGVSVDVRGFATHKSLIKLRASWHKKIIKATEDVD